MSNPKSKTLKKPKVIKAAESSFKEPAIDKKTEELLKKAEAVIAEPAPEKPAKLHRPPGFMPAGMLAGMILRKPEDIEKVPAPVRPMVIDDKGEILPQWRQVANLMDRPNKKLAIVGFADTKTEAPFDNPEFEIWGLNDLHNSIPRYDRWFDTHTRDNIDEDYKLQRNQGQIPNQNIGLSGLRKLNVPVYMQDRYEDIPNSIKFPLAEMLAFWKERSLTGYNYLTNSISIMIAYALYEGVVTGNQWKEVSVFGVDMAVSGEYSHQRPSCEYWIGIAEGMGVKVFIPPASDLCRCRFIYAFEQGKQDMFDQKLMNMLKNMDQRRGQIASQEQQAHDARMQYEGAIGFAREVKKVWSNWGDAQVWDAPTSHY